MRPKHVVEKVNHKNIEPRIFVVVTVNPFTLTYCNTQQDAHREDLNEMFAFRLTAF
jgi:hypothetical protein